MEFGNLEALDNEFDLGSDLPVNTAPEPELVPIVAQDDDEDDNIVEEKPDLISSILSAKGINPESIKIVNDKGENEEIAFSELSHEEQLEILNYNPKEKQEDDELAEDEVNLINILRENNITAQDYINYHKQLAVQEYLQNVQEPTYEVDSYSDDELFIADLQARTPDLTDEEALEALENAKINENLFSKTVAGIRSNYKQIESTKLAQAEEAEKAEQAEKALAFEQTIIDTIKNSNSIDLGDSSIDLSNDDMNEIASFILDEDVAGVRHLAKALNDPKTLVEMAWYALKGKEALNQISDYYKKQISEVSKTNYNKGYEDAKKGKPTNPVKKTVVKKNNNSNSQSLSIYDLD